MTDDPLDDLKAAFAQATPAPDAAQKTATLRQAEKNFDRAQGSLSEARPTPDRSTRRAGIVQGARHMLSTFSTRGALTASTAIVAVGLIALIPVLRDMPDGPTAILEQPEVVVEPLAEPMLVEDADGAPENELASITEMPLEAEADDMLFAEEAVLPPSPEVRTRPTGGGTPLMERAPVTATGMAESAPVAGLISPAPMVTADLRPPEQPNTEAFANADDNPVKLVSEAPVSTFSIDVDTASYAIIRSSIMAGQLPPEQAVRIEEMINYFDYDFAAPAPGEGPFKPTVTVASTPWNPDTELMTIALQGEMPSVEDRPPLNLVFLIDTSGSMQSPDKLPLLKQSFRLMLAELRPEDQVAIVTYAGSAGLVLEATEAADRTRILAALDQLEAGGSTAGQAGIEQAYAVAEDMTAEGEVTRVILATDGDFNVGMFDPDALKDFIADKRDSGTYLSVLGFGRGNLDDATMQALAQNGNGTAAYIDTLNEAQKVLVDQLTGALFPIANDVKIQVEFNPAAIAEYRLIGYETRALRREDFNNDKVDAGEIGAGHTVVAIYEITPVGSPAMLNDPLRYGSAEAVAAPGDADELAFLRLRYKTPGDDTSQLLEVPVTQDIGAATIDTQFAAAIAGFGQLLADGTYTGDWGYDDAIALASANLGDDAYGYRRQAIDLMRLAQSLSR